jgi:hypothetical protein
MHNEQRTTHNEGSLFADAKRHLSFAKGKTLPVQFQRIGKWKMSAHG